jgi:NhaP-type Na+/H+ or K+/H+ antiporter
VAELGIFTGVLLLYALVSGRAKGWPLTAPMVFVAAGVAAGAILANPHASAQLSAGKIVHGGGTSLRVAQIALALLLFTDASRIDVRARITSRIDLPGRLLLVGLPLKVAFGAVLAWAIVPGLAGWEACLVGAVLAPTDLALGQVVVTNRAVPQRVREALNVEGGLNDGLAVPFFTVFLVAAAAEDVGNVPFLSTAAKAIGYGLLVGVAVGFAATRLIGFAHRHGWMTDIYVQLSVAATAVFAWWGAEELHGSGFIAAFAGGLTAGFVTRGTGAETLKFSEDFGRLLNLLVFFGFGLAVQATAGELTWRMGLYAVLSLTVVRMLPVLVSLRGTRLRRETVLFMGWFGPRGLASVVFTLLVIVEEPQLPGLRPIVLVAMLTILASVFLHGASAVPLAKLYARRIAALPADAPELELPEGAAPAASPAG